MPVPGLLGKDLCYGLLCADRADWSRRAWDTGPVAQMTGNRNSPILDQIAGPLELASSRQRPQTPEPMAPTRHASCSGKSVRGRGFRLQLEATAYPADGTNVPQTDLKKILVIEALI